MSNAFEEIIQPFNLDSSTFYMKKTLQIPISLDIMNYNYYIKLLQVQFSNVVPNVDKPLYVKNGLNAAVKVVDIGIYDMAGLCNAFNALGLGTLEYNSSTGKCKLTNDTANTLNFVNQGTSDFLTSAKIGFNASQLTNIPVSGEVIASHVVVIQDYNYFILTSDNIIGNTMTAKSNQDTFEITNVLWTFSSAMKPLQFRTWTAIMPILFKVETPSFQYITFEMRDGNGNKINDIVAQSDFHIDCQLVRQRKL